MQAPGWICLPSCLQVLVQPRTRSLVDCRARLTFQMQQQQHSLLNWLALPQPKNLGGSVSPGNVREAAAGLQGWGDWALAHDLPSCPCLQQDGKTLYCMSLPSPACHCCLAGQGEMDIPGCPIRPFSCCITH